MPTTLVPKSHEPLNGGRIGIIGSMQGSAIHGVYRVTKEILQGLYFLSYRGSKGIYRDLVVATCMALTA